ncbi:MAG: sigma-70 family RNA polymerase sigma factor [Clostridia bacterium]|nr:sigma-70 family RNA polymerase sigma factor [Clostridia bacterium]
MAAQLKTTNTSEYDLFSEYRKRGTVELRNEIVHTYIYIAEILSRRFINRGIEYDDIYQVACMGLIYAVERFDPDRGVKFATFATPTIMGEIRRHFRDKGSFIRIPRKLYEIFYRAERIKRRYDSPVSEERIARTLRIPADVLRSAYEAGDSAFVHSLEYEADADGALVLSNLVGHDENGFMMVEDSDFIEYCMSELSEGEKEFVRRRFYNEESQSKIAADWQVSQMYVSRMEKKILKKLKNLYFRD